ncbi:hypothetical protein AAGC94_10585 [Clostridium sporogenes]|uniref:hypothetical protein n=2 Tax=Bacteria TaxID=2 RepID=UPI00313A9C06
MNYKYKDGRIFVNPLIGCSGGYSYCYLIRELEDFSKVRKNKYSINDMISMIKKDDRFILGREGTIISIGSYCDIFPLNNKEFRDFSLEWISKLLQIGNPVQIISKNKLPLEKILEIKKSIKFENQLLYSTTITSFSNYEKIEKNSSSLGERLITSMQFKKNGIPTNLMIKPFIPKLTKVDLDKFKNTISSNYFDYVVVGELYITKNSLSSGEVRVLDCTENQKYEIIEGKELDTFFYEISKNTNKVYRKSSCVNANLLKVQNLSYINLKKENLCIDCGNCK